MLKKFSKFLLIMLVVFLVSSSSFICFADEEIKSEQVTTTETNEELSTTGESEAEEPKMHTGDLYIFDNEIVMDKYVDGNVFLFGDDVKITGKVNGNLFVFGNNVKFDQSVVRYSIFAYANSIYYNGGCGTEYDFGNLYVAASKFESTFNSYVTGDFKSVAPSITLKSAVYRNVDLISNNINFGENEDIAAIYGNLNYTSNKEISIPEGVVVGKGNVTYTPAYDMTDIDSITDILIGFASCIVLSLALYIILNKVTPEFVEKVSDTKLSFLSLLKYFGIGLATIAIVLIFIILLICTMVGISLAVILALLFAMLCIIALPVLIIKFTNSLKPILKIEKTSLFYLVIVLISIILHGITLIPYVGGILGLIINITAIGFIITVYLPHKELTEEEKLALEELIKQSNEIKEKKKEEKLEAKSAKKQQKLGLKKDKEE